MSIPRVFRKLLRSPAFTIVSVLTMAVGIGATTAIFSVVDSVLLESLPYPDAHQLVTFSQDASPQGLPELGLSPAGYLHYLTKNRAFEQMGVYVEVEGNLTGGDGPERLTVAAVSWGLLAALGVPPVLGRPITKEDDVPGVAPVAILSHGLWVRRFGADPNVLGSTIQFNGASREVIGVMGPRFAFPSPEVDLWIPLRIHPATRNFRLHRLIAVARLKQGVTLGAALRDIESLIERLPEAGYTPKWFPNVFTGRATVRTLKEQTVGDVERSLVIILATVGFVLLIACTNVANLFLVRAEGQQREVAVRTALGAGRGAIIRQVLEEAVAVSVTGGVLGLGLAYGGLKALVALRPEALPRLDEIAVDSTVLLFTGAVSVLSGLLFGMFPALQHGTTSLVAALKEGDRSATSGRERHPMSNVLVIAQVALALVLLVGAGLMVRSFWQLHAVDPGFNPESVLTVEITLPGNDYRGGDAVAAFYQQLLDRLEPLPGVEHVGAVTILPLTRRGAVLATEIWDFPLGPNDFAEAFRIRQVAPGYFAAMGIPVIAGRTFDRWDHEQHLGTAIISETMAQRLWPDQSPIGKLIQSESDAWARIVGVVGSVRDAGLADDPTEMIYMPMVDARLGSVRNMNLTIKASLDPSSLVGAVRREVRSLDPNLPISNVRTMGRIVGDSMSRVTFTMLLLGIAAGVALFLGAVGIYGVISYAVSQRTSEIGVRIALGAQTTDVTRMVLQQALALASVGVAGGLIGAFALTRLIGATFLYQVSPADPLTYGAVAALFLVVALVASYVPARRAAGVDPIDALRTQ